MDIRITKKIYKKEEALEMMEQILGMIERTFKPGWWGDFTVQVADCMGPDYNDPPRHGFSQ